MTKCSSTLFDHPHTMSDIMSNGLMSSITVCTHPRFCKWNEHLIPENTKKNITAKTQILQQNSNSLKIITLKTGPIESTTTGFILPICKLNTGLVMTLQSKTCSCS
jgi:hypothetical protein